MLIPLSVRWLYQAYLFHAKGLVPASISSTATLTSDIGLKLVIKDAAKEMMEPDAEGIPFPKLGNTADEAKIQQFYKEKRAAIAKTEAALFSRANKIRMFLLPVFWSLVMYALLGRAEGEEGDIKRFDPFDILGLPENADDHQIKKAYRKLSLQYHPDRWAGVTDKAEKAEAEAKFIKIAKAYESLTDEVAKENYKLYGNPDGRQALELSIGLPAFLLAKENQIYVISSYLLFLLVILPATLVLMTTTESSKAKSGILPDTDELYRVQVGRGMTFTQAIELFAFAEEFRSLNFRNKEERELIEKIRAKLVEEKKMPKVIMCAQAFGLQYPGNLKCYVLILLHMTREVDAANLTPGLKEDLIAVLSASPKILKRIVEHARTTCSHRSLASAINLMQHINQAMFPGVSPLAQLPHLDAHLATMEKKNFAEVLTKVYRQRILSSSSSLERNGDLAGKQAGEEANSSSKSAAIEAKDKVALPELDSKDAADLDKVLRYLPVRVGESRVGTLTKEIRAEVVDDIEGSGGGAAGEDDAEPLDFAAFEFEEVSVEGDTLHVVSKAVRASGEEAVAGAKSGKSGKAGKASKTGSQVGKKRRRIAWTPYLPHTIEEEWYVVVSGGPPNRRMTNLPGGPDKISSFGVIPETGAASLSSQLKIYTVFNPNDWMNTCDWPKGEYEIKVKWYSNAYVGLDFTVTLKFKLEAASLAPKGEAHPEDKELENDPSSLFEMLNQGLKGEAEVDSDFELPEPGDSDSDDDDDDDEEGEEEEEEKKPSKNKPKQSSSKKKNQKKREKARANKSTKATKAKASASPSGDTDLDEVDDEVPDPDMLE